MLYLIKALLFQRASTAQLSEMVQTWPNRELDTLCKGILNQVGCLILNVLVYSYFFIANIPYVPLQVKIALSIFHADAEDTGEASCEDQPQVWQTCTPCPQCLSMYYYNMHVTSQYNKLE